MAGALVENTDRVREFLSTVDESKDDWVDLFDKIQRLMENLNYTGENKFKLTFLALWIAKS